MHYSVLLLVIFSCFATSLQLRLLTPVYGGYRDRVMAQALEQSRKKLKPSLDTTAAKEILRKSWGLEASDITQLESYDDVNFKVTIPGKAPDAITSIYTLKIHNGVESEATDFLEAQGKMLDWLAGPKGVPHLKFPTEIPSLSGAAVQKFPIPTATTGNSMLAVRLLKWVDGPVAVSVVDQSPTSLESTGHALSCLHTSLCDGGFSHTGLQREHMWDLARSAELTSYLPVLENDDVRELVSEVLETFKSTVLPVSKFFRCGPIHGDFNDGNLVLSSDGTTVSGVLDFGDSCNSWLIADVAIAMAYAMLSPFAKKSGDPIGSAALVLRGYSVNRPLPPVETMHLRTMVAARLAASILLGAAARKEDPGNEYLLVHAAPAVNALKLLWEGVELTHVKAFWEKASMGVSANILLQVSVKGSTETIGKRKRTPLPPEPVQQSNETSSANDKLSITFVTGNKGKLEEVKKILGSTLPFVLENEALDLPELQGPANAVAAEKCRLAVAKVNGPVMVEDTSLSYTALGGLPGVYIKWFLEAIGHEGLVKLLVGYEDKSADAVCIFAFCPGPGHPVELFEGRTAGKIVPARSVDGPAFGWDPVFEPSEGGGRTYAEMSKEDKNKISHRFRALDKLRNYLHEHADRIGALYEDV